MIIRIDKSFDKDVSHISDKKLLQELASYIERMQEANKPSELSDCKKSKGGRQFYRIKLHDYRIGMTIEGKTITLIRFLHRKEIYRFFP